MATNVDTTSLYGSEELSPEQVEALNQMIIENTGVDIDSGAEMLAGASIFFNIIGLIFFITFSIGLYKLSKKFGDKHSWLAFIPIIQFYTLIKTAGLGFWKGFWGIILRGILAGILIIVIFMAAGYLWFYLFQGSSNYSIMVPLGVILYLLVIFLATYITYYFLYKAMAERAGQNNSTAILMTLFPFVMLWIVANRIEARNPMKDAYVGQVENDFIKEQEKIEL